MKNISELLKLVKLAPFLEKYTSVNPKGGIYHRINGKATRGDKPKDLTEDDNNQIKEGLKKLVADVNKLIETL